MPFRLTRLTKVSNERISRSLLAVAGAGGRKTQCTVGVFCLGAVLGPHSLSTWAPGRSVNSGGQHGFAKPLGEAMIPKKGCSALISTPQVSSDENKVHSMYSALCDTPCHTLHVSVKPGPQSPPHLQPYQIARFYSRTIFVFCKSPTVPCGSPIPYDRPNEHTTDTEENQYFIPDLILPGAWGKWHRTALYSRLGTTEGCYSQCRHQPAYMKACGRHWDLELRLNLEQRPPLHTPRFPEHRWSLFHTLRHT